MGTYDSDILYIFFEILYILKVNFFVYDQHTVLFFWLFILFYTVTNSALKAIEIEFRFLLQEKINNISSNLNDAKRTNLYLRDQLR